MWDSRFGLVLQSKSAMEVAMSELGTFSKTAKGLARNPLGIIALFIVLIYGFAALTLGINSTLLPEERLPLVWFLVLFPTVVLFTFAWLVINHHEKLYAPSDYRDDTAFMKTLSPEQQRVKVDQDVKALVEQSSSQNLVATPEPDIRTTVVIAEDLVIRELESEYGVSINRQVSVGNVAQFDGVLIRQGEVFTVEVKYTPSQLSRTNVAEYLQGLETIARNLPWRRFKAIYAVVFDDLEELDVTKESSRLQDVINAFPFNVILKIYGLKQLKEKFGVSKTLI